MGVVNHDVAGGFRLPPGALWWPAVGDGDHRAVLHGDLGTAWSAVGAKDWMLAFGETGSTHRSSTPSPLDRAAACAAAERLHSGRTLTPIEDGTLGENAHPDDGLIYVAAFDGLTLVCTGLAVLDNPSQLPPPVLTAIPASQVYLHAMHSVVDWFAYAVWTGGQLRRSLSLPARQHHASEHLQTGRDETTPDSP
jgi:hypothetical protein